MSIDVGITSLADIQSPTPDGATRSVSQRVEQIVGLGVLADELDFELFGLGEHHNEDFVVSSPAVVLAAIAARTHRIRLASAVTVLSTLDPVRVYEDYATLDVLSGGRAEIAVGRSAYPEPFDLFGEPIEHYDALFAEKLDLLLRVRESPRTTWRGRFRTPLQDAAIVPRAVQQPMPIWVGVGGTPASAIRAGQLGLPMTLGYLGGTSAHLQGLAGLYRKAGADAGHEDALRLGIALHLYAAPDVEAARASYPYYHNFMRPKQPGGPGYIVDSASFDLGMQPGQALMIGTAEQILDKLAALYTDIGYDRIQALVDWGGLPAQLVEDSIHRVATDIAPHLRAMTGVDSRKQTPHPADASPA
jgi:alkanesulfonate monooxygenase SsuD/methylene tetrahydromethanopterin reductase-like flavin-dependent oxidoreductase (luciferase family)